MRHLGGIHISTETRSPAYTTLSARPLRMGVLVPEIPGLDWRAAFAGALASQTRIWGGSANLLLPLRDGLADSALFWALVELWDADWWGVSFLEQWGDLGRAAEYASQNPGEFVKAVVNWEDLSAGRYGEWLGNLVPDALLAIGTAGAGTAASRSLRGRQGGARCQATACSQATPSPGESQRARA